MESDFALSFVQHLEKLLEDFQQELVDRQVMAIDFGFLPFLYWGTESGCVLSFVQQLETMVADFQEEPIDEWVMVIDYDFLSSLLFLLHQGMVSGFVLSRVLHSAMRVERFHVQPPD